MDFCSLPFSGTLLILLLLVILDLIFRKEEDVAIDMRDNVRDT